MCPTRAAAGSAAIALSRGPPPTHLSLRSPGVPTHRVSCACARRRAPPARPTGRACAAHPAHSDVSRPALRIRRCASAALLSCNLPALLLWSSPFCPAAPTSHPTACAPTAPHRISARAVLLQSDPPCFWPARRCYSRPPLRLPARAAARRAAGSASWHIAHKLKGPLQPRIAYARPAQGRRQPLNSLCTAPRRPCTTACMPQTCIRPPFIRTLCVIPHERGSRILGPRAPGRSSHTRVGCKPGRGAVARVQWRGLGRQACTNRNHSQPWSSQLLGPHTSGQPAHTRTQVRRTCTCDAAQRPAIWVSECGSACKHSAENRQNCNSNRFNCARPSTYKHTHPARRHSVVLGTGARLRGEQECLPPHIRGVACYSGFCALTAVSRGRNAALRAPPGPAVCGAGPWVPDRAPPHETPTPP
jgi:hypothetical protein